MQRDTPAQLGQNLCAAEALGDNLQKQEDSIQVANKGVKMNRLVNLERDRIVSSKLACELLGLKRSTFFDKQNSRSARFDPSFPQRVRLSSRRVGWLLSELERWLSLRIAERN